MRNMSFMLTTQQVLDRTKTVTRRADWRTLQKGTRIQAIEKGMGLKKGEKTKKLAVLEVTRVTYEPLDRLLHLPAYAEAELKAEGFPHMTPQEFVDMFCESHKGVYPGTEITRIEFKYVDGEGD